MNKRILSVVLTLTMILSVLSFGAVSASAEETATVRVGGESISVAVGDYYEYTLSVRYTGGNLTTAQAELPFDFNGLSCYTQSELDKSAASIAPTTGASSTLLRLDNTDNRLGMRGYVMNFVSASGYSFATEKTLLSLVFCVEKAGVYDLAAKLRYVEDANRKIVIGSDYQRKDNRLTYTERLDPANLEAPVLTAATAAGGVRVSWQPVRGAAKYRVFRKNGNSWTKLGDTDGTSFLDTDVVSGSAYTYTVRCLSRDASKYVSDFDHAGKTATYYPAPTLRLSNAEDAVKITWDAIPGAAKYRVFRKNGNSWTRLTDTDAVSCTDSNVTSGVSYTYTIRTLNSNGNYLSSYYSDGFTLTYLKAPVFVVSNAPDGVKITWDAVQGAENYRVFYKGSKGWTKLTDTADTEVLDTDVRSGKTYTYTVRCINADGSAYVSDYRTGKSVAYYPAPVLKCSNAEDGVKITWDAIPGAAKYRVFYKGRNGWTKLTDTASTSCIDSDVRSGATYTYMARAMDSSDYLISSYYPEGFAHTFIGAPAFSVANAPAGVKISWNAVSGAQNYRVFYKNRNGGWSKLTDTAETSVIDADVRSGATYTYTVRCINADGSAYISDYRTGRSVTYYPAPVLGCTNAEDGVRITWSAVSGAAKYRVFYKGKNGWTRLTDTASTSCIDSVVSSGVTYTYTVRAMNSSGSYISSYYPEGASIMFLKAPEFTLSSTSGGVQISWSEVKGAVNYRVFRKDGSNWKPLTDTANLTALDKNVTKGQSYTYTVRCISEDGSAYTSDYRAGKSVTY